MRRTTYVLAGLAGVGSSLADYTAWLTTTCTETAWQTKAAETMWSTEWSTTTCWSTKPAVTVTWYSTITSEYEKDVYTTIEQPTTIYDTLISTSVLEKLFTTTLTSVSTIVESYASIVTAIQTQIQTQTETIFKSYESDVSFTATETSVITKVVTTTETVASVATSLTIVPGKGYTSTLVIGTTKTITQQQCISSSSTLTGLVLCPTRITNPTYTPAAPLPTDYTWGCKPGQLCKPKQVNCNFEVGYPAVGYVCSPDECIPAETPPADVGGPFGNDYNSTCPWYEPFDDYFNLPPPEFGLSYTIFAVSSLGIAAQSCPPVPTTTVPPSTTSYTTTPPPPPPPVTSTSSPTPYIWPEWTTTSAYVAPVPSSSTSSPASVYVWSEWTTSSLPPAPVYSSATTWSSYVLPAPEPSTSYWSDWVKSSSTAEVYSSAASWADWKSAPYSAHSTGYGGPPRLRVRITSLPAVCYNVCNNCGVHAMSEGKTPALCLTTSPFEIGLTSCNTCISTNSGGAIEQAPSELNQFILYCDNQVKAPATSPAGVSGTPLGTSSTTESSSASATPTTKSTSASPPPPSTTTVSTSSSPPTSSTKSTTSASTTTPSTTSVIVPTSLSTTSVVSTSPSISPYTTPTSLPQITVPPGGTTTACAVSQISDGQPQAADCTIAPLTACALSQISDGQPQASDCTIATGKVTSTSTVPSPTVASIAGTGGVAAATGRPEVAVIVAVVAVLVLT